MRSLGLYLRPDGFDFVLCDGNAKKYAVIANGSGGLHDELNPVKGLGKSIAETLKIAGISKVDKVTVALPSTASLYRELNMPFGEREKIQQVLKFEIESELYHLEIDDVVCDFLELTDDRATTTLLVVAQPKKGIAQAIEALSVAGLEAPILDMDVTAMSSLGGLLPPLEEAVTDSQFRAMLHLGSMGSELLVYSGKDLRVARALHLGWRDLTRDIESSIGDAQDGIPEIEAEPVEDSGESSTEEGSDEAETSSDEDPLVSLGLFGAETNLSLTISFEDIFSHLDSSVVQSWISKLTAEVHRSLLAASLRPNDLSIVGPSIPGLASALSERLDLPVEEIEMAGDPVALGASLRGFSMPHGSLINLRQEEYRYTQGLERVERPLTFALVSLIAFFLVDAVSQFQQGRARFRDAASLEGDDKHSSLVELAIAEIDRNLNQGLPESPPAGWRVRTDLTDFSPERYMNELRIRVLNSKRVLDEEVGAAGIPMSESSLDAWRLVMEVLQEEMGESQ